jgi:hypothetical protein
MHDALIVLVVIFVFASVIVRQLKGEPLRGRRVVLLPVVLIAVGALNLRGNEPFKVVDAACIGASAMVAIIIGIAQGLAMRLESRQGSLWGQMPVRSLWLWAALVASRLIVMIIALVLGARSATSINSILLVLGVNRLAQAVVIALRAHSARVPFSPEKSGKTFLSGLLGDTASGETSSTPFGQQQTNSRPTIAHTKRGDATWTEIARRLVSHFE